VSARRTTRAAELHPWRRIAVQLAVAGDGSYRLLSTQDRDELEAALAAYRRDAQDRADRLAELGRDDADRGDPP
jgi:hypothetical protein